MIYFFDPYDFNKKLFNAYDLYFNMIDNVEDWVCIKDGDVFFFHTDFGHRIQQHIDQYPETGLFTCFTNRIGRSPQLYSQKGKEIDSIKYHYKIADSLYNGSPVNSTLIHDPVTGLLMVIKKATWLKIRAEVAMESENNHLLGVDIHISNAIFNNKLTIRRMDNIYVFHYYRFVEGNGKAGRLKRGIT